MRPEAPIGVFDSGVGGLTVAHAIKEKMPREGIFFFGDTAHLPYGDKSEKHIQEYSHEIISYLFDNGCKAVVIACNSASVSAYELLRKQARGKLIINVIDPLVASIASNPSIHSVGLIGTKRTVSSNAYEKRLLSAAPDKHIRSYATPLLAPMIEEGFVSGEISEKICAAYLSQAGFESIDALILACTHYPLIADSINTFFKPEKVELFDSRESTVNHLQQSLAEHHLLNKGKPIPDLFCVSDYTPSFEKQARLFFGNEVQLKEVDIW